jgi:hypothetical protein
MSRGHDCLAQRANRALPAATDFIYLLIKRADCMPFCQCPKCKTVFTIQVADSKAWYAEKWPGYSTSEVVPEVCSACSQKAMDRMTEMRGNQPRSPFGKD